MGPELLQGDCVAVMATLAADSFDAVCTDPPYGVEALTGYGGSAAEGTGLGHRPTAWVDGRGWNLKRCRECSRLPHGGAPCRCDAPLLLTPPERWRDYQAWCEEWARAAFRVMKPGAHLTAFAGTRTGHRLAVALEDAGFEIRDTLLWLYGTGKPKSRAMLKPSYEPIILARKPLTGTLAQNIARHGTGALAIDGGRWPTNLITDEAVAAALGDRARYFYCPKPSRSERDAGGHHPTQKPLTLMRWLCRLVTPQGGRILDPFMGSGTTGIAALHEGFAFTGIERDAAHVATATHRMAQSATIPHRLGRHRNGGAMDDSEYVTLTRAAQLLGISRWSLYRRIDEGALPTYASQTNRRVRLVKRADVERMLKPVPATPVAPDKGDRNG